MTFPLACSRFNPRASHLVPSGPPHPPAAGDTSTPHALRDFLWINFGFDLYDWADDELRF